MNQPTDFSEMLTPEVDLDALREEHLQLHALLERVVQGEATLDTMFERWDGVRRRISTWSSLTYLRFAQNTRDVEARLARERADSLRPEITELAVDLKRALLASPLLPQIEALHGPQLPALWRAEVAAFDPALKEDLVEQARVEGEYEELLASASFDFEGESLTLSALLKYRQHADRALRERAERARWGWYADNAEALDDRFDQLVHLRHKMARALGLESFVPLGYRLMSRIGYDAGDVARWRDEILERVVPLCVEINAARGQRLGVDPVMYWDEELHDLGGNPTPGGDVDWIVSQTQDAFDALDPALGEFLKGMTGAHLLDLDDREGKAGGGFCTDISLYETPFIFANFNGTQGDVRVLLHELGHAFQCHSSQSQRPVDYVWPTTEACEIHSMSLEYLAWPQMERLFPDSAEQFRRQHLISALFFLPYGAAIDHFQHLVYAQPDASPAERHALWQQMEAKYLPWRRYGDLPHVSSGGLWQRQRHVFLYPFYYIDYTLALCCALQFWARSQTQAEVAMRDYVELCQLGGSRPFGQLVASARLQSPFSPGSLAAVVDQARAYLG